MTESRVWKLTPGASVLAPGTWASFDGAPPAPPPDPPPDPDPDPDPDPEPTPDYVVSGDGGPEEHSPNGDYFDSGETKNGEPIYTRDDGVFSIWLGSQWAISTTASMEDGTILPVLWLRGVGNPITGDYTASATSGRVTTGTATVTAPGS